MSFQAQALQHSFSNPSFVAIHSMFVHNVNQAVSIDQLCGDLSERIEVGRQKAFARK